MRVMCSHATVLTKEVLVRRGLFAMLQQRVGANCRGSLT